MTASVRGQHLSILDHCYYGHTQGMLGLGSPIRYFHIRHNTWQQRSAHEAHKAREASDTGAGEGLAYIM